LSLHVYNLLPSQQWFQDQVYLSLWSRLSLNYVPSFILKMTWNIGIVGLCYNYF
jgi:hypothetical protein